MIRDKIGRNDPCHCNSGLKYKKCCLNSNPIERIMPEDIQLHQAQNELKQKVRDKLSQEATIIDADAQIIKISEVILEFAADLLKDAEGRAEKKQAIDIACLAWNLAVIKATDSARYEKELNIILMQIGKGHDEEDEIQLLTALVDKKIKEYPLVDRFIVQYQVKFKKNELMLHVASAFSSPEAHELTHETG